MNIIQIQDRLKGMTKEAIIQYVQNPTGEVPTYLALGELQRRKDSEAKFQAMQEQPASIAEQIVQENMPMGLGSITPSEAMSPSMAMSPEAGVMQGMRQTPLSVAQPSSVMAADSGIANLPVPQPNFAGGGIVAFEEGGKTKLTLNPNDLTVLNKPAYDYKYDYEKYYLDPNAALIEVPNPISIDERIKQQREAYTSAGVDPGFYKKQADELMAEREALKADKSEAANMALIKAGFSIMGGTSQFAFENIGKGAMPAIESYGVDIKDIKAQERLMKQSEMKMAEAEQAMARGDVDAAMKAMEAREDKILDIKSKNADLETQMLISNVQSQLKVLGKNDDILNDALQRTEAQFALVKKLGVLDFVHVTDEDRAKGIETPDQKAQAYFNDLLRNNLAAFRLDTRIADSYKFPGTSYEYGPIEKANLLKPEIVNIPDLGRFKKLPNGNYVPIK